MSDRALIPTASSGKKMERLRLSSFLAVAMAVVVTVEANVPDTELPFLPAGS